MVLRYLDSCEAMDYGMGIRKINRQGIEKESPSFGIEGGKDGLMRQSVFSLAMKQLNAI